MRFFEKQHLCNELARVKRVCRLAAFGLVLLGVATFIGGIVWLAQDHGIAKATVVGRAGESGCV